MDNYGRCFAASYSGGKDSAFALYRAIKAGMVPHTLVTTYNTDAGRSWFHGLPEHIFAQLSEAIGIPTRLIRTTNADYADSFKSVLTELKHEGIEAVVFGDIDIEGHREWCTSICGAVGLDAIFPLWQEPRKKHVHEFIDAGFKTVITSLDTTRMPENVLGSVLTYEIADEIEKFGADIAGENGEYHTFTFDGPIFKKPIEFKLREKQSNGDYSFMPVI